MPSGKAITKRKWLEYLPLRDEGFSLSAACAQVGISKEAAHRAEHGKGTAEYQAALSDWELRKPAAVGVIEEQDLSPVARAALNDIEVFASRYFGLDLMPFQVDHIMRAVEMLNTPEEEYLVVNMPPGTGKSTVFTKVLPAFVTCRDRSIRGQIGSLNAQLATQYVRALRVEFERDIAVKPTLREERLGLMREAQACLRHDFGQFKPEAMAGAQLWQNSQFVVRQHGDMPIRDKEPTWAALSPDGGMIGMRASIIIWDDVYDATKHNTPDSRTRLYTWFDNTAETRLEPGGLFVLQGQRLNPVDIYRHALDMEIEPDPDVPGDETRLREAGLRESDDGRFFKYHHIVSPAHHDDTCQGEHGPDAKPYPDGCLLYPARLPWAKLRGLRSRDMDIYRTVYQQEDGDPEAALVQRVWVHGGTDKDGVEHRGAWDEGRATWQLPLGVHEDALLGVMTVDPSPTNFWALQAWAVQRDNMVGGDTLHLLDAEKIKMRGPDLLDWDIDAGKMVGWVEDWRLKFESTGVPMEYCIVEHNVAQRWLTQTRAATEFSRQHTIHFMPHTTGANKSDPKLGVPALQGYWRAARVRLPGDSREKARALVDEVCVWNPEGTYRGTDDQVMAQWFLINKMRGLPLSPARAESRMTAQPRPSWITGGRPGLRGMRA